MLSFKNYTRSLPCVSFSGQQTNCWDVIDAIQIHAYARTAAEVLDKIRDYREGTYEGGTRHMNFNFIFLVPHVSAA